MAADRFAPLIRERSATAGLIVGDELGEQLAAYLSLLWHWNRKINLTSFDLDAPTPAAIDRLVIEPLLAARLVRAEDRFLMDVGSGGGSPALPLRLACAQIEIVMVESRSRKAAFLREVARSLALANVHVEATTFEVCAAASVWAGRADLVTMRAVRPEPSIWDAAKAVLKPTGRFLWFTDVGETAATLPSALQLEQSSPPVIVFSVSRQG
jgi:16S rRNA (guanine527-N7)-methyltransferase